MPISSFVPPLPPTPSLPPTDLVVCSLTDMRSDGIAALEQKLRLADNVGLLLMVEADALKLLRLPAHIRAEFRHLKRSQ